MRKIAFILSITAATTQVYAQETKDYMKSERYARGLEKLMEIDGEAGEKVVKSFDDLSPELGQFIIEFAFGDVYSANKMDVKLQEIAVVSALIAQGLLPQLKVHLYAALHVGNTVNEIKGVILQMASYVGYPKVINAMNAFREVLAERKAKGIIDLEGRTATVDTRAREVKGAEALSRINAQQAEDLLSNTANLWPQLSRLIIDHAYGDLYSNDVLPPKTRQIATIAALAALGTAEPQLRFHIQAGFNVGVTVDEMNSIILLMVVYAGFPAAINHLNIFNQLVAERSALK